MVEYFHHGSCKSYTSGLLSREPVVKHWPAHHCPDLCIRVWGIFQSLGSHISRNYLITPANHSHGHHPRVQVHLWTSEPVKLLSCVRLFAIPWTIAYQAPPFMEFSRQEYCSGLPFPSPISESSRIPLISRFQRGTFYFCPKYWRRKWQPTRSILAWEIPWAEEPGGLQSTGLQRVGHDLATKQCNNQQKARLCRALESGLRWVTRKHELGRCWTAQWVVMEACMGAHSSTTQTVISFESHLILPPGKTFSQNYWWVSRTLRMPLHSSPLHTSLSTPVFQLVNVFWGASLNPRR